VCSAIFFVCDGGARDLAAVNLNTTFVLELDQPDFSTDAGNSALISQQNLRAITQFQFGVTSAEG
jgi:hypothetical protein